jgi:hypothetical protein
VQVEKLVGDHLVEANAVTAADTPFVKAAIGLMQPNLELVQDSDKELAKMVTYPLPDTLADEASAKVREDNLKEVAEYVLAEWESGALREVRVPPAACCTAIRP